LVLAEDFHVKYAAEMMHYLSDKFEERLNSKENYFKKFGYLLPVACGHNGNQSEAEKKRLQDIFVLKGIF